jgi:hypothetical protein
MSRTFPAARLPVRLLILLGLLLALLGGCAGVELPRLGSRRPEPIAVEVEELVGDDGWRVTYRLPEPFAGVFFPRARTRFRKAAWSAAAAGAEATWHDGEEGERLCFTRPTDIFAVAFSTWTEPLPKDYELNVAFSDGGRLLYTGHLLVEPLAECTAIGSAPAGPAGGYRFDFATAPERSVLVLDEAGRGSLSWRPEDADRAETYVYFGGLARIEAEVATIVLDPGLPAWMVEEMEASLPRLLTRFAEVTGHELPFRPLLLVAWGGDGGSGRSFSGGSLPGLFLASAEGPGWLERTPDAWHPWFDRFAHETFHLWAGETFRTDESSEWLSEAAADHFALEAAVDLGVISRAEAGDRLREHGNECIVRLAGRGLMHAAGGGDFKAWYACGVVALAYADAELGRVDPELDLGDLFEALFAQAARQGTYGGGIFVGGLERLGVAPDAIRNLRRLIGSGIPGEAGQFLAGLLEVAGVESRLVPPEEAELSTASWRAIATRAIGRCYCGERREGCDPVAEGARATTLAGIDVRRSPREAWERLRASFAHQAPLELHRGGEVDLLFCPRDSIDPSWRKLLASPA